MKLALLILLTCLMLAFVVDIFIYHARKNKENRQRAIEECKNDVEKFRDKLRTALPEDRIRQVKLLLKEIHGYKLTSDEVGIGRDELTKICSDAKRAIVKIILKN